MPIEVKRWMASDGTLHESNEAAKVYEQNEMIYKRLVHFCSWFMPGGTKREFDQNTLANRLFERKEELRKALDPHP